MSNRPVFEIAPNVSDRFPDIRVLGMRANGTAKAAAAADPASLLKQAAAGLAMSAGAVAKLPVLADWRAAYGAMGVKPSRYRSSIESLFRRAEKGSNLQTGIAAVDLYNACSLHSGAPIGAYDVARLPEAAIQLRSARPKQDRFEPLGGKVSDYPLSDSLVIYAGGDQVLCWGFNVRDSAAVALCDTSDDVIFFSEAVTEAQGERSERALEALRGYLIEYGGLCSSVLVATAGSPSFVMEWPREK